MHKLITALAVALALTGCTTLADAWTKPPSHLADFENAHATDVIAVIGEPTRTRGQKVSRVYEWIAKPSKTSPLDCRISLSADASGRIVGIRSLGPPSHCEAFSKRLRAGTSQMVDEKQWYECGSRAQGDYAHTQSPKPDQECKAIPEQLVRTTTEQ